MEDVLSINVYRHSATSCRIQRKIIVCNNILEKTIETTRVIAEEEWNDIEQS
jgi:hypothetical protein